MQYKDFTYENPLFRRLSSLPRDKTDTLLLIITCTCVLLPFAQHTPLWINLAAVLLIIWRVWITLNGQALPKKLLLIFITGALFVSVYGYFRTWLGKDVSIALLILLACLKMLEMHAKRDAMAVIFVCYFLLVGQLLYSQSLLAAMYLLFCIAMLINTQLAFQYYKTTPSLSKRLASGFKIVGLAIPLAVILFLLFPRLSGPLWGKPQQNLSGVTGLSDTMEPGNVVDLALSDQIAFRVKFLDRIPPPTQLYWRAIVLDTFNGKRWSANSSSVKYAPMMPIQGTSITQEIILEPHNQRWLFGLDRPSSIDNETLLIQNKNGIVSSLTHQWELRSNNPIQDRLRYTVTSYLSNTITSSSPNTLHSQEQYRSLQLPPGYNPLTLAWTRNLREQYADPSQLINLVLNFFREQPFRYTLSPPPLGTNQVDDFMFNTQAGFCEHYASAFVIIMRALGIPSRVVTGYQGGEINAIDGLMTIRQADAHAWADVWIKSRGWVRIDPTAAVAPSRIERGFSGSFPNRDLAGWMNFTQQGRTATLIKSMRQRWDAINSAWNLWVLNYNLNKQRDLLSHLTGIKNPQTIQLAIAMMIAVSFVAAVLLLVLFRKRSSQSPLDKVYEDFCRYMESQGYPRLLYEGPRDYEKRLQLVFQHSKELEAFLSIYSESKYGKGYNADLTSPLQLTTLKALLKLCLQLKTSSNGSLKLH